MKIFFLGEYQKIGGPYEVNKNLLSVLKKDVLYPRSNNPLIKRLENLYKILISDVVIFSGLFLKKSDLIIAHLLKKKIIYLMHGCVYLELGINSKLEKDILEKADLILCVSQTYKNLISRIFPKYKDKIEVLTNAINWEMYDKLPTNTTTRDCNRIILIGGGRIIKRNLQICEAVQKLNKEKRTNLHVDIYGEFKTNDDSLAISNIPCATFHDYIPHENLLIELCKSALFIQNSDIESFSLGTIEALICGCNILISKNVGAKDIISNLNEEDIINDTTNVQEIQNKINHIIQASNNKRLLLSINKETTSIKYSAKKLLKYAQNLMHQN